MDKWNKCHLEIKYIMRILHDIRLNIISKLITSFSFNFQISRQVSNCVNRSQFGKYMVSGFPIHCRAATGSEAAKAWSLAGS